VRTAGHRAFATWLLAALLAACTTGPSTRDAATPDAAVRAALAPTGRLRIGVYPGSPTSMLRDAGGEPRGLSVEIGQALARRLGVPGDLVVFERVAQVVDAVAAGRVDFTITNASPARAQLVDFTPPVLALELGVLVMPGSRVASVDGIDADGIRIGVTEGSTSQATLGRRLAHASIALAPSVQAAQGMLRSGAIDAFATNKAILFEMSDGVPGSRVLDGRWGLEHLAIAVPKGREAGRAFLAAFAETERRNGDVARAVDRAGLRGVAPPDAIASP